MDDKTVAMLENFFSGYERKIADLKQNGEMSLIEGKKPLSFSGFRFLANEALDQHKDTNLGILCFSFVAYVRSHLMGRRRDGNCFPISQRR
jgi:hypothetical protein